MDNLCRITEYNRQTKNRIAYEVRVETHSCHRELQATMDKNEGTRMSAMMRNVGPGIWSGFRAV